MLNKLLAQEIWVPTDILLLIKKNEKGIFIISLLSTSYGNMNWATYFFLIMGGVSHQFINDETLFFLSLFVYIF